MSKQLQKPELLSVSTSSVADCGWNVAVMQDTHPFRLRIYRDHESVLVRIYIWNITHGGGKARPAHEYRIQITGVTQFEPEPGGKTLILGWWNDARLFTGFDYEKHSHKLGASPSFQVRKECLDQAYLSGFAPCLKDNGEIAVAFKQEFLVEYILCISQLHQFGESQRDFDALQAASAAPDAVNDAMLDVLEPARRIIVTSVAQRLRASSFRARVLAAYSHQCAFCGLQLDLVQAAHVLPVNIDESTDHTSNGIAACFLHHAAYDRGLIAFNTTYDIVANEEKMRHLVQIGRDRGMEQFRKALRPKIILPPSVSDRPNINLIAKANAIRGW
jgi:putative restriction endonuclease